MAEKYNKIETEIAVYHFSKFNLSQKDNTIADSDECVEKITGKDAEGNELKELVPLKKMVMVQNAEGRNDIIIRSTNSVGIETREITLIEKAKKDEAFGVHRISDSGVESIFFRAQKGNKVWKANLYFNENSQRIKLQVFTLSDAPAEADTPANTTVATTEQGIPIEEDYSEDVIAGGDEEVVAG